jgi:4-carboxymuconolactone decarboxylase
MSTPHVPLVQPGTRAELAEVEGRILAERGRISLLYQALLNSEPIASGWERMLTAVRKQTLVPGDLRELIILRVAVLNRAAFEFDAHAPIAAREGVTLEKILAIKDATLGPAFDQRERLVLALTDAMTQDVEVPQALMTELKLNHDPRQLVELVATVAAYNMVSRFLVALNLGH